MHLCSSTGRRDEAAVQHDAERELKCRTRATRQAQTSEQRKSGRMLTAGASAEHDVLRQRRAQMLRRRLQPVRHLITSAAEQATMHETAQFGMQAGSSSAGRNVKTKQQRSEAARKHTHTLGREEINNTDHFQDDAVEEDLRREEALLAQSHL